MRYAPLKGCLAACSAFLVLPLADVLAATSKGPSEPAQLSVPGKKKPKDKVPRKPGPSIVGPKAPGVVGPKTPGVVGPKIPDRVTKPYPPSGTRPDTHKPDKPRPDTAKPDRPRPDTDKPDKPRPEIGKPELPRPDPRKPDRRRPEVAEPKLPRIPPRVFIPEPGPERERYLTSVPRRSERGPPRPLPALEQAVSRQLVVLINQDQPASVEADLAGQYGLDQLGTEAIPLLAARVALFRIRDRRPEQQVIAAMTGDGRVREVQLNYRYRRQAGPAEAGSRLPQYGNLKVELPGAHELAQGRDVVVAVIDSAVDVKHPDLEGAVAGSFDAVGGADKSPDFHGTAIAGIIRARGVLEGVAPESVLLAVRAFQAGRPGEMPQTSSWVLLKAMDWAVANKAKVLNLSFSGPRDPAVHQILQAAAQRGVVAVAAAGNGGPKAAPAYPAAYPEVIAVTALDERDRLYQHANRGSYIFVAAPGVDILAPVEQGKHSYLSGTSFAAAYVSGIVALLLERDPGLAPGSIAELISNGSHDLGPKGRDDQFGAGRVNALQSLQAVSKLSAEKR
jgi:subtilisin family serine protease